MWTALTVHAWYKGTMHSNLTMVRIGFLYEAFRPGVWFWQVINSAQLLLVVGLSALLLNNHTWQPILILSTIVIAMALHSSVGPYALPEDNLIMTISMTSVAIEYISNVINQEAHEHSVATLVSIFEDTTLLVQLAVLSKPLILLALSFLGIITERVEFRTTKDRRNTEITTRSSYIVYIDSDEDGGDDEDDEDDEQDDGGYFTSSKQYRHTTAH
jgi:hypothetical protein